MFDAVAGLKVPPEGVVPSSDLFPAAQRLPWQTGPQAENSWDGLRHTLRTALSIGASGVPVQVHGIGSASRDLAGMTPELYLRWLAMGVFSANSFQGVNGLMPWDFGDEVLAHVRTWMQWRYRLVPYVLGAIEDSARTGCRCSARWRCPSNDEHAHDWDLQYLLGPALLVAPITEPGKSVGVPAQGRRLVGPEHGPSLRRRHHLDAGVRTGPVPGVRPRRPHALSRPRRQHTGEFNSARILDEVWMFGMPVHNPVVMRNKIRVMQMQGSSYIKGLEGLRISPSEGLEVAPRRRGPYLAGALSDRGCGRTGRRPGFPRNASRVNKGSQEGFPSRLPLPDARTSRSCLLALLANSIFLVVIKMKNTVVLFRREKIQNRLP